MGRIAVAALVSLWVIPISILVNHIVPDPYMDEIFHIPQAQQYCKGNFRSWDPMITTPPGLYYLSLAHVASLFPGMLCAQVASSFSDVCSTAVLRSINGILAVVCSILFYEIIIHLRPALDRRKATLCAVILALYPLHWFFTFLYYTDVASLTAVLAMYLAALKKNYQFSALLGVVSILIRQTNIIWMLFVACTEIINITMVHQRDNVIVDDVAIRKNVTMGANLRKRKLGNAVDGANYFRTNTSTSSTANASGLLDEIQAILISSWHLKYELLVSFCPFFVVLVAFAAFILLNGSVVLGAKEAHAVSPHLAQILYFSLVSAISMAPLHFTFSQAVNLFQLMWKNRPYCFLIGFLALTAGFLSVHFFSLAHPYLLADNRHYTFYLWRRIIGLHWSMKYILVPLYIYSWLSIFSILEEDWGVGVFPGFCCCSGSCSPD
ncbi:dol-P-Glc:Glc(2)Man(9)GlcNAc(2)-PP-Dol alpha-1,2-glucosyltransferase isoform X3 [Malania oleifera]|uniref:dol-P-Glc:Glc(2)Man(9)GlcNAc(2)-PP-Dol alpha-1,2-glucosyltransferase isoform X3 n=1 Tax=Malania oleifera TaxID=397392 RepID=UPI0025AE11F0|nr:dol-P-Glc:Glc(2)Man(9)GlcNAc(2)-PP-Dol alpha-1,2-glucosyltransferase isoform X3 [Malania oleifera]XP_057971409.1 dol-P-Glc:Glc(2)Man(9)GlcNAc(2)-PP-Dol alpha-1,2-glucosyltransferase isoform X3 [Malania oleifera]